MWAYRGRSLSDDPRARPEGNRDADHSPRGAARCDRAGPRGAHRASGRRDLPGPCRPRRRRGAVRQPHPGGTAADDAAVPGQPAARPVTLDARSRLRPRGGCGAGGCFFCAARGARPH
ncbi:hypothetical protein B4N89_43570 [Embleya scabrispora]|uniref:Uncharacterized protein n=1 Tax=Embleya scabrispora TaxID=159449 RepID=A0A1T3NL46_9ACTN|nr:hypothetical protein B4N89_43570 [Embleya scabrispora]